jgi:hypothetical protein
MDEAILLREKKPTIKTHTKKKKKKEIIFNKGQ